MNDKDIFELRSKYNFHEYLDKLQSIKDNCLILMAIKDTPGNKLADMGITAIKNMGFRSFSNKLWVMHIGIMVKGIVIKDESGINPEHNLSFDATINDLEIKISSKAWRQGNDCVIQINGYDYAQKVRGINIVVYDFERKKVIDSIGYDSHLENHNFIRNYVKFEKDSYRERCSVMNVLPEVSNKIKIRIVHVGDSYFWNVVDSLVKELVKRDEIDLKIILFPFTEKSPPTTVEELNLSYVFFNVYNIETDQPDILIFTSLNDLWPYKIEELERFRKNSKLLVCIPVALILNAYDSVEKYRRMFINRLRNLGVDYLIMDRLMYHKCLQYEINEDFMVELGNPKFDSIYRKLASGKQLPNEWEKIRNRKIILWLVDHDWETGTNVTFDLYAKSIFSILRNELNLALIFRPHPHFMRDTKKLGIWNDNDVAELKRYINSSPNIIWDESSDYSLAYQCADYIFSDVESGTIISAMVTRKPICIMYRNDCIVRNNNPEVVSNFYSVRSEDELDDIVTMIKANEDPMYEQRCNTIDNFVSHFDGKNGERIKDFLLEKYKEMCNKEDVREE